MRGHSLEKHTASGDAAGRRLAARQRQTSHPRREHEAADSLVWGLCVVEVLGAGWGTGRRGRAQRELYRNCTVLHTEAVARVRCAMHGGARTGSTPSTTRADAADAPVARCNASSSRVSTSGGDAAASPLAGAGTAGAAGVSPSAAAPLSTHAVHLRTRALAAHCRLENACSGFVSPQQLHGFPLPAGFASSSCSAPNGFCFIGARGLALVDGGRARGRLPVTWTLAVTTVTARVQCRSRVTAPGMEKGR